MYLSLLHLGAGNLECAVPSGAFATTHHLVSRQLPDGHAKALSLDKFSAWIKRLAQRTVQVGNRCIAVWCNGWPDSDWGAPLLLPCSAWNHKSRSTHTMGSAACVDRTGWTGECHLVDCITQSNINTWCLSANQTCDSKAIYGGHRAIRQCLLQSSTDRKSTLRYCTQAQDKVNKANCVCLIKQI